MDQNEELDKIAIHRRRLLYRASHRGTFETDILIGEFAKEYLPSMSESDMRLFEQILDIADADLAMWLTGQAPVPDKINHRLFQAMIAYAHRGRS